MSSRVERKQQAKAARLAAERAAEQQAARRRRLLTLVGVLAVAGVIVVAAILVSRSGTEPVVPPSKRMAMFDGIAQKGTTLGSAHAPVVVEEFVDLQCPFCAQYSKTGLPPIVRDFVRSGEVQLDLNVLSFVGDDSVKAGRMAAAAGLQDRQWQFVEAFYERQKTENSGYVDDDFLREVAGAVPGLDTDRALGERTRPEIDEQLQAATRAAGEAKVTSTPSFRVGRRGGQMRTVDGDKLPQAIAEELKAT
jgi:protein-disulfide isomerase